MKGNIVKLIKRALLWSVVSLCAFLVAQKEIVPIVKAQNAKMILVEKPDSEKLKTAYAEFVKAYDKWDAMKKSVAKGYVNSGGKPLKGWEGVSFSVDFRILVPAEPEWARGGSGPTGPSGPSGSMSVSLEEEK